MTEDLLSPVRVAVLLAAIVVGGCGSTCPPSNQMEKTIPVASLPDDAGAGAGQTTAELVSRCQAAADQCVMLCWRALGYGYYYSTCELVGADGGLAVHAIYGALCPV